MTIGLLAMSLYVVVGTWLVRIRIPDRLEIAMLTFGVVAALAGIGLVRMARMQVRADGPVFIVRGLFVEYRSRGGPSIVSRCVEACRPMAFTSFFAMGRSDGSPVLDPGIAPAHVDATRPHEMAARLNAILLAR